MESKKDIGNYFKENLEQLDYSPSPKVWDGIEVELKKKKKRRFLFWMFFAVVAILSFSTYTYVDYSDTVNPSTKGATTKDEYTTNKNSDNRNSPVNNINSKNHDSNESVISCANENEIERKNELVDGKNTDANRKVKNKNIPKLKRVASIEATSNRKTKKTQSEKSGSKNSLTTGNQLGKYSEKAKKSSSTEQKNTSHKNEIYDLKVKKTNTTLSDKEKINSDNLKSTEENTVATSDKTKKLSLDDLKSSNQKKRDSLVVARKTEKEKKDLAQKPKEEENDSTTTEKTNSGHEIIIAPYYGYNYNGNLGNGNFLNDSKTSKKESQFQSSYGVLVRWMGSDKIGFQMGVGIINSTYSATFEKTNNSFIPQSVASLNYTNAEINNLFPNGAKVTSTHESSFIEIPIEGYYLFSDKKIGLATTFGLSFLLLQDNELFLESENVNRFKAGKLKNIAPFSFTANAKLNLFYKISKRLQLDLYPSIQYQAMGFKDISNYHSYIFSIKTGLSYKL